MPLVGVSPLGPFFVPPLGPSLGSPCLLASYAPAAVFVGSSSHPLAFPSAACFLLIGSSARPLPRIARLPAPFDTTGVAEQSAAASLVMQLTAGIGWRAAACLPRMATGCGRSSTADGGGRRAWLFACLGAIGGAARSFLDRFSFPLIVSSNRRGPGSSPSSHHLIDGGGVFFSFSPDPLPPTLLGLLALACSPVPGRGMRGLRHGLRRRACGLFACVLIPCAALSLPLVRSLLYDLCQSCRSFLPGVLWGVLWVILPAILSALVFLNICP